MSNVESSTRRTQIKSSLTEIRQTAQTVNELNFSELNDRRMALINEYGRLSNDFWSVVGTGRMSVRQALGFATRSLSLLAQSVAHKIWATTNEAVQLVRQVAVLTAAIAAVGVTVVASVGSNTVHGAAFTLSWTYRQISRLFKAIGRFASRVGNKALSVTHSDAEVAEHLEAQTAAAATSM